MNMSTYEMVMLIISMVLLGFISGRVWYMLFHKDRFCPICKRNSLRQVQESVDMENDVYYVKYKCKNTGCNFEMVKRY